jgi:serine/threonine protein kinase
MGVVFVGVHERLGREVAVKILRADMSAYPDAVARFQREAELVTRIGHPGIVTVYDYGRAEDGSVYYVMELISGRPLRARLQEGPLSDGEVVDVFAPLLAAVQSAHAVGAVHRDLKPDEVRPLAL